jgi:hypothetical protein
MKQEIFDSKAVLTKKYAIELKRQIENEDFIDFKKLSENIKIENFSCDKEKNGKDFIQASAFILKNEKEIFVITRDDNWKINKNEKRNISGASILFSTGFKSNDFGSLEKLSENNYILSDADDSPNPNLPRSIVNYSDPEKNLMHSLYGRKILVEPSRNFNIEYFGFGYRYQKEKDRRYFFGVWKINLTDPVNLIASDSQQKYDKFRSVDLKLLESDEIGEKLIFDKLILSKIKKKKFNHTEDIKFSEKDIGLSSKDYKQNYVRKFTFLDILRKGIAKLIRYNRLSSGNKESEYANEFLFSIIPEDTRVWQEPKIGKTKTDAVIINGSNKAVIEFKRLCNFQSEKSLKQVYEYFIANKANEAYIIVFDEEGKKEYEPGVHYLIDTGTIKSLKVVIIFINVNIKSPTGKKNK